ncbi:uncharacterized protein LOC62_01G000996 [Vanrija pseudolonga]|uniref:F-box domain-containing protein n=1 Tax=Vanrija pseudolonga TaxID=143232 RepID=A0AAF0Y199_9TREE|nr:hypothetical protein LOC62_01G000996 [Vanrija pseudolonga]
MSPREIPPELLHSVIAHLGPGDSATLAALARCATWTHAAAIPALYAHVHVASEAHWARLYAGLSLDDGHPTAQVAVQTDVRDANGEDKVASVVATAARKLGYLLHTRHVTLDFVPSAPGLEAISGTVVLVRARRKTLRVPVREVFPRVQGLALGAGFVRGLLALAHEHHAPCGAAFDVNGWEQRAFPAYFPAGLLPRVQVLGRLDELYDTTYRCFPLPPLEDDSCAHIKGTMIALLASWAVWGRNSNRLASHSAYPAPLAPWTRIRARWRHFVRLDSPPSPAVLDALARDVYAVSTEALAAEAGGGRVCRRDVVLSGLDEAGVRAVEAAFVAHVRETFDKNDRVVVDRARAPHGVLDSRYGDDAIDAPDAAAVRGQVRVVPVDFLHADSTGGCEACGAGCGREPDRGGQEGEYNFWAVDPRRF